jgi:hypothetical protein
MKKFWYVISTILAVAVSVFSPAVQAFIASHASVAVIFGTVWTILGNLLTPPVAISIKPTI